MKKILVAIFAIIPIMGFAQSNTTLTPEQKLEQAQKQLEEAQKAVELAKVNAAKAQKEATEAKANAEARTKSLTTKALAEKQAIIQDKIKKAQEETIRLNTEAERLNNEAKKLNSSNTTTTSVMNSENTEKSSSVKNEETVTQGKNIETQENTNSTAGWSIPDKSSIQKEKKNTNEKKSDDLSDYLAGAVPTENGNVVFTLDYDIPGKNAQQIYDITYNYVNNLTQDDNQKDKGARSNIVLVNKNDHEMVARFAEWIVFNDNFFSLDRSEMDYTLIAKCTDGHIHMTMERINYNYEEQRSTGFKAKAEDSITDEYSLNKKKDNLNRIYGKFRKATIDRKNKIFNGIKNSLN